MGTVEALEVSTMGELIAVARELGESHVPWFRGQLDAAWDVVPAIWRGYTAMDERNLTNRFRSRAAIRLARAPHYDDSAGWLSLMQHYGLPTRLLDWSRSPLVAANFAVERCLATGADPPVDAAVWVLLPHPWNAAQGLDPPVTPSVGAHLCEPLLAPAFTHAVVEDRRVLAAMAAETDLRMFVQQGCFTIHGDPRPMTQLEPAAGCLRKLVVPAGRCRDVAQDLYAAGFRRGDIFPDLENLAAELRQTYPPGRFS